MKKTLLTLAIAASAFAANSQVACTGVSPSNISGDYAFEWADPGGNDWATPDFLTPGQFVQDTLAWAEDGTPGNSATYGHPISQEACNALDNNISDVSGKIAILYRGECEFGEKALNAENAGAVAVIIINHTGDPVGMGGGAQGLNVTIPVVMIGEQDGADVAAAMQNGPVVFFLGNKIGIVGDDVGAKSSEALISPWGGANTRLDNGFDIGLQVYNYGSNPQSNLTVTATIDGPSGQVYNQVINAPMMNTGDTLAIFEGNTYSFPPFDLGGVGNYPTGTYTLTYNLDIGIMDSSDFDNVLTSTFTINDDVLSLSNIDGNNDPVSSTYPSNSTTEYQSCTFFEHPNASALGLVGLSFVPYTDIAVTPLAGEEIFINIYEWNDTWTDLTDPGPQANNDWFTMLNQIGYETYYPASDSEAGNAQYVPFSTPFVPSDNQRYLFCLQSFNPEVGFGYDGSLNYDGNQGITAMPVSPVFVDDTWFTGGWVGPSATSVALHIVDPATIGIDEITTLEGKAFPNPANDIVTIAVNASGNAHLTVTDVAGKIAMNENITLEGGNTQVNIDALETGVYIFNVELENGLSSQFNVVKK